MEIICEPFGFFEYNSESEVLEFLEVNMDIKFWIFIKIYSLGNISTNVINVS